MLKNLSDFCVRFLLVPYHLVKAIVPGLFKVQKAMNGHFLLPGWVLHYGVRRGGCAPVLGSFWPGNSGIGIYFYWKITVIGVYLHLEFSWIGVYCYTKNAGNGF